ncbi:unnamed protein product [Rhizoctonia solani]|uniref:Uncharacterized protein n=1 Tax=Rhizoctonia solani TaxID=456999 RepID=A0A8H3CYD6_9AGAM|nr:unnamed protein product [Rhizoctonia solani]
MEIEIGSLDRITCTVLENFIATIRVLIDNQAAIWDERPWDEICRFIKQRMPENLLEGLKECRALLKICFQGTTENMSVSIFHRHVLERIRIHAEEVERVWLGSAATVQLELEETLAKVWKMIREAQDIAEHPSEILPLRPLIGTLYGLPGVVSSIDPTPPTMAQQTVTMLKLNVGK